MTKLDHNFWNLILAKYVSRFFKTEDSKRRDVAPLSSRIPIQISH